MEVHLLTKFKTILIDSLMITQLSILHF